MWGFFALLLLAWLMVVAVLVLRNRSLLAQLWAEPVLRRPVLIIESDDWGAGPLSQTTALQKLSTLLMKFKDGEGRHPVMTLGMVMAIADTEKMKDEGLTSYQRLTLKDERFSALRQTIADGINNGVFTPQLHGMEHYWPAALMQAANDDESVRHWLTGEGLPQTELLPSALQSRWIDASVLPALMIDQTQIADAVSEELAAFRYHFEAQGIVVVPPTFVWTGDVEQAWAEQGVDVLVTPGFRYEGRDASGTITPATVRFYNGQQNDSEVVYIVRDEYFEPTKGHKAERVLDAIKRNSTSGRPTLLESHRFNFVGTEQKTAAAFVELERMLSRVSDEFPRTAFISTEELARIYRQKDTAWLTFDFGARLSVFVNRCRAEHGLRRWLKLSGLSFMIGLARGSA